MTEIRRAKNIPGLPVISALELPPCEMPSDKLYAINESDLASMAHDSAKKFLTEDLERLGGASRS